MSVILLYVYYINMGDLVKPVVSEQPPKVEKVSKDNMDIVKLNISLNTNKNSKLALNGSLFVFDDGKKINGDFPFLCTNVKYNVAYFDTKTTFYEKVQIFFSKPEFEKFVLSLSQNVITDGNEKLENIRNNILITLRILFPISFPVKDDVAQISKNNSGTFDFQSMFNKVIRQSEYVYLNIDKPSTVTQAIWLDTITSNPEYVELYELMKQYRKNLITYVFEKYARKDDQELPYAEIYSNMKKLIDQSKYGMHKFPEKNQKLIALYEDIIKTSKIIQSQTKEKLRAELDPHKKKLQEHIEQLKELLRDTIDSDTQDRLQMIDTQINTDRTKDKQMILDYFTSYREGRKTDDDLRKFLQDYKKHGSTWWKLYFILSGLKKNTSSYNTFVDDYVKQFISSSDDYGGYYYRQSTSNNENKFYKNLADLDFHFEFIKKVEDFVKQRRKPLAKKESSGNGTTIADIFKDEDDALIIRHDAYMQLFIKERKSPKKNYTGVDVITQSKPKDEEEKSNATTEYKARFYEIQLAISLVGGRIPKAPSNFWCAFNSAKLAKDYNFLTKYDLGEIKFYPYVEIQEEVPDQVAAVKKEEPKEFNTILNAKNRGGQGVRSKGDRSKGDRSKGDRSKGGKGARKTRNKRSFAKTTRKRSFYRNFQEKQSDNN